MHQCRPRLRAFTMVEVLVAASAFSVLGLILYGVASEGLTAFARNVSINRSYADARRTLDRIGLALETAGYTPQLIDATGANTTATPAAGIRFWRYGNTPCYNITTPALTDTSLTLSLIQPGSTTVTQPAPAVSDLISIPALGFQATATTVTVTGSNANVTFSGTVDSNSSTTAIPATTTQTSGTGSSAVTKTVNIQYFCLDWNSVAFITVGTQLRYYPAFVAGTTSVSDATKYKVLTNLVSASPSQLYSVNATASTDKITPTPALPFSLGPTPSINVSLYAEAPDYNNRKLGSANTYSYFQTALSPRNPSLLTNPP